MQMAQQHRKRFRAMDPSRLRSVVRTKLHYGRKSCRM